jgi:hypothetical protein
MVYAAPDMLFLGDGLVFYASDYNILPWFMLLMIFGNLSSQIYFLEQRLLSRWC